MMEQWFGTMQAAGVRPDVVTYSTLLKGYAREGNMAKCQYFYDQMVANRVKPNVQTFSTLMDACANGDGDMAMMEQWFGRMQAAGVKPNVVTYNTLLKGYAREGNTPRNTRQHSEVP
uniref:Pentacotripeptide-repeat region of PRORP domain-containing protein n=1 Tax=Heterosigma akashiwo TaxID=2829 RepID=A0A7S3Y5F3_HETAK